MPRLRQFARRLFRPGNEPTARVAAELVGARSCTVLDVGARWGTDAAWYTIDPLAKVIGFEPDPVECARLNAQVVDGSTRFVPVALGAHNGEATLHVTQEPGCSSLLRANPELIARYPALCVMTEVSTMPVQITTLAEWASTHSCADVAFMKLDVQGAELDVLRGAGAVLDRCVGLEVEVEFMSLYEGQPLFADIDAFLRARGFVLWRLTHLVHYAERHRETMTRDETTVYDGVHVHAKAGAGRLAWGHAIYMRDYATVGSDEVSEHRLVEIASLLDAMGDSDGAAAALDRLLSRSPQSIVGSQRTRLERHISALRED